MISKVCLDKSIIRQVSEICSGNVLQFGIGEGTLINELIKDGNRVFVIESSERERSQYVKQKNESVCILQGEPMNYYLIGGVDFNAIINVESFRYLSDEEKEVVMNEYCHVLSVSGSIICLDYSMNRESKYVNILKENGFHVSSQNVDSHLILIQASR